MLATSEWLEKQFDHEDWLDTTAEPTMRYSGAQKVNLTDYNQSQRRYISVTQHFLHCDKFHYHFSAWRNANLDAFNIYNYFLYLRETQAHPQLEVISSRHRTIESYDVLRTLVNRYLLPQQELEHKFESLVSLWLKDTGHFSSVREKFLHPSYQEIIGFGRQAVPLLLKELTQRPNFWFWALKSITGEDPTKPDDDFEDALNSWIEWGIKRGYVTDEIRSKSRP